MTLIERYILAAVMTEKYISDDATYEEWIDEYRLHRKRIAEVLENESNIKGQ